MGEPFLGMVCIFPYNFAPRGWAFCQGQLMSIAQNSALFSLLGTTYGGDGRTTFGLPDLRGRMPIGSGQGPGLPSYDLGELGGATSATLTTAQLPAHNHPIIATSNDATEKEPANQVLANDTNNPAYAAPGNNPVTMAIQMVGPAGGSQPFGIQNPYQVLNYCIALEGIFPSRS